MRVLNHTHPRRGRRGGLRRGLFVTACAAITLIATTTAARAGDTPAGFWYGADGSGPSATGSGPSTMPTVGGSFGGYVGELGTWTNRLGCTSGEAWNAHDAAAANTNHFTYHRGVGTGGYWFAGGPGADPHYNATTSEAYAWGKQQGEWAYTDWQNMYHSGTRMPFQILWMDIENAGNGLANGWGEVFARPTTCTRHIIQTGVAPALDRATFNGYWDYLHTTQHNVPQPGAYSAPQYFDVVFGSDRNIPNTWEWSYEADSGSVTPGPSGWCQKSSCAEFFGGQTSNSKYAVMWQWSQHDGDSDQIDANRLPSTFSPPSYSGMRGCCTDR